MTADPVLLDFPDQFQTERLLLRSPRPGDGQAIYDAARESMQELMPWMPWAHEDMTVGDFELWARQGAAKWLLREDLPLVLFRQSDEMFVGGSGLHRINWEVPLFEIGYWVRTSLQGQGYITEAVKGVTAFAFEHLGANRLEIRMDTRNTRSFAVAERAGYAREATFRHDDVARDGSLRDTYVYVKFP